MPSAVGHSARSREHTSWIVIEIVHRVVVVVVVVVVNVGVDRREPIRFDQGN